ncbi:hypothetical protein GOP47_0009975 [Adiantum capillus-veneris]|uniref:Uncharacterized protein n=1 Tax=Adiantum capillus-veneris TaxID=13818 RepID=A0A9D4UXU5_ADICA|nr:hypothetical protein GOP47_0009975 [Adiantum capillus-veneris]
MPPSPTHRHHEPEMSNIDNFIARKPMIHRHTILERSDAKKQATWGSHQVGWSVAPPQLAHRLPRSTTRKKQFVHSRNVDEQPPNQHRLIQDGTDCRTEANHKRNTFLIYPNDPPQQSIHIPPLKAHKVPPTRAKTARNLPWVEIH